MWVTTDYQRALYDLLKTDGRDFGLKSFGGRALNCMRIEKASAPGRANTVRSMGRTRRDSAASST